MRTSVRHKKRLIKKFLLSFLALSIFIAPQATYSRVVYVAPTLLKSQIVPTIRKSQIVHNYFVLRPAPPEVKSYIVRAVMETGYSYVELQSIVQCESDYSQSAVSPVNKNGSRDYGLWQINEIHFKEALALGLDVINNADDNTTFAIKLLKESGLQPWSCRNVL